MDGDNFFSSLGFASYDNLIGEKLSEICSQWNANEVIIQAFICNSFLPFFLITQPV